MAVEEHGLKAALHAKSGPLAAGRSERCMLLLSRLLFGAAGVVLAWGAWFMCHHEMGHGAVALFAVPFAVMAFCMYAVGVAIVTQRMGPKLRLVCAFVTLVVNIFWIGGVTGVLISA